MTSFLIGRTLHRNIKTKKNEVSIYCRRQAERKKLKKATARVFYVEQTLLGESFWAIGFEYWSTGNITDKMVNEYLEHHRKSTLVRFKNLWNYSS
jgi:putative transposase